MTARFEIVRTDAEQPWRARLVVNGRIGWRTENYTRMVGAERAILTLLRATEAATAAGGLIWNVVDREKIVTNWRGSPLHGLPLVDYIDERDPSPIDPTNPLDMRVPSFERVSHFDFDDEETS